MEVSECRVPLSGRRLRLLQLDPQRPRAAFAADACERRHAQLPPVSGRPCMVTLPSWGALGAPCVAPLHAPALRTPHGPDFLRGAAYVECHLGHAGPNAGLLKPSYRRSSVRAAQLLRVQGCTDSGTRTNNPRCCATLVAKSDSTT